MPPSSGLSWGELQREIAVIERGVTAAVEQAEKHSAEFCESLGDRMTPWLKEAHEWSTRVRTWLHSTRDEGGEEFEHLHAMFVVGDTRGGLSLANFVGAGRRTVRVRSVAQPPGARPKRLGLNPKRTVPVIDTMSPAQAFQRFVRALHMFAATRVSPSSESIGSRSVYNGYMLTAADLQIALGWSASKVQKLRQVGKLTGHHPNGQKHNVYRASEVMAAFGNDAERLKAWIDARIEKARQKGLE